ncbi:MAG: type IV conjugative transfer system protein TraL [Pseudomonadota bacterium]
MSGPSDYYIPKRLDDPEKIGFWTIDEAIAIAGPFALGIVFKAIVVGIVGGLACYFILKKMKGSARENFALYMLYWHFPSRLLQLKSTPSSFKRRLAG